MLTADPECAIHLPGAQVDSSLIRGLMQHSERPSSCDTGFHHPTPDTSAVTKPPGSRPGSINPQGVTHGRLN